MIAHMVGFVGERIPAHDRARCFMYGGRSARGSGYPSGDGSDTTPGWGCEWGCKDAAHASAPREARCYCEQGKRERKREGERRDAPNEGISREGIKGISRGGRRSRQTHTQARQPRRQRERCGEGYEGYEGYEGCARRRGGKRDAVPQRWRAGDDSHTRQKATRHTRARHDGHDDGDTGDAARRASSHRDSANIAHSWGRSAARASGGVRQSGHE
jgi:hypothetical protein